MATGWSDSCRAGFAPAEGWRLSTAHCTCVYYNNPCGEAEEAAARKRAVGSKDVTAQFGRPGEPVYPPEWLRNPAGSPRRGRWLRRMAELGYFDLPTA